MRDRDMLPIRRRRSGASPYDLFKDFVNMDWVDDMVGSFGSSIRTDVRETENEYIVDAEMPGFNKEDIEVEIFDERLTVRAKRHEDRDEEGQSYLRRERRYGEVSRSFSLQGIKNDGVTAQYDNGILRIVLPKTEEAKRKGTKIDIQ
ncbi:MAG: Hsp20/alpha crystallin family protein [Xylanivirga thermophila]|jgi:HSP20 family protein|uniref:Hsp20/alpha crystallin family protein n=1 Tax=Xylanivirga thermophila TaxID=2496273 RepID=UPI0039F64584